MSKSWYCFLHTTFMGFHSIEIKGKDAFQVLGLSTALGLQFACVDLLLTFQSFLSSVTTPGRTWFLVLSRSFSVWPHLLTPWTEELMGSLCWMTDCRLWKTVHPSWGLSWRCIQKRHTPFNFQTREWASVQNESSFQVPRDTLTCFQVHK